MTVRAPSDWEQRFPALGMLCGGYLGQHWDYTSGSPEAAVLEFCASHRDDVDSLTSVVSGLDTVFAECTDERSRLAALTPMGFCYWPGDGKLDAFLLWARATVAIAASGGELPRYRLPRSPLMASTSMFLGCYAHLPHVGARYFRADSAYASAYLAIDDYAETAAPEELIGTYEGLLM